MGQVVNLGVLMFACRTASLRKLDKLSDDATFRDNWCTLSRVKSETVLCPRQMTNVLGVTDPGQLGALRPRLVKDLIRHKQLPDAFLLGHLMAVSDGTGIFASSEFHCPQCLTQRHQDGSMTYMHNVLETKVITWNGLALSIMTEPQLNPEDGQYDKQDCESKAFKRLLPRLKQEFSRQPLVHLLDGGYCNGPIFKAIVEARQQFICCFKPGSIPTLYEEALTLRAREPGNGITQKFKRDGHHGTRVYTWVNGLQYQELTLDFVMCQETVEDKTTTFAYLTTFPVNKQNVITIADGGRKRWTIENEGFNVQKTGYELEHFCDCSTFEVMFALYLLLQLAHAFMQLLARSDLIDPVTDLTFLAQLLLEALRNQVIPEALFALDYPRFQIRFDKAPT